MAVYLCKVCGARLTTRSEFEVDCDQCGAEEALVELDAYDPEPRPLRCAECGWRGDGAPPGTDASDWEEAGLHTIDDDCPVCGEAALDHVAAGSGRRKPEYAVARGAARKLRAKHGPQDGMVDIEKIAVSEGMTIRRGPFRHEGMLVDHGTIEVPNGELMPAQRFLIAHELGHFKLRHELPESKVEAEANAFAAELVMPVHAFKAAVEEGLTPEQLRRRFGASRQATTYALMRGNLINKVRVR